MQPFLNPRSSRLRPSRSFQTVSPISTISHSSHPIPAVCFYLGTHIHLGLMYHVRLCNGYSLYLYIRVYAYTHEDIHVGRHIHSQIHTKRKQNESQYMPTTPLLSLTAARKYLTHSCTTDLSLLHNAISNTR